MDSHIPSYKVLSGLSKDNLFKIAAQEGLSVSDKDSKKKILDAICADIEEVGIKQITSELKKTSLEELCEPLSIDHEKMGNNPTKTVLRKRLMERMQEEGTKDFLESHFDVKLLANFIKSAEVDPVSKDKAELVEQAVALVDTIGLQTYLNRFDTPFLRECMDDLQLKCETDSKPKIVYAIATQTSAKSAKVDREIVYSKKKLPIAEGVTYQDIFQHYLLEEIQEWCRDNGLKVSGTKKELINRILAYFDGDTENTMAPKTNEKKTTKEEKSTKEAPKSPKKTKETKEKSPKNKKTVEAEADE